MRFALLLLLVPVLGYALITGWMALMQGRMIYPSAGAPGADVGAAEARGWAPLSGDGAPRAYAAAPADSARATVVVFHGNGGVALDRAYYADALGMRGLRVVLAEYPGYGGRPGTPSEALLASDGAETIRQVRARYGSPVLVWGESLGAGVAAAAVAQAPEAVGGVVLLTPWDSLLETAKASVGWLPVGLLLRDRYDSVANLAAFGGPVAVVVAGRDEVIPPARGLALYERLRAPKRLWTFPEAGHNTWPVGPREAWWDEVLAFTLPGL